MDKETLSNYGWIVVCVMVLAVLLALASPFGTFVAGAIKSTTAGLFSVNQAALGSAGIDVNDMVFENCDHLETEIRNATDTYTGDTCCKACGAVMSAGQTVRPKVPEGATYTAADGTVYNPGDEMPEVVMDGDTYADGEYMYKYNYYGTAGNSSYWYEDTTQNGWAVIWLKYTGKPSDVLSTINGKPLTAMRATFLNRTGLPADMSDYIIPDTVTNIDSMFGGCSNLITLPNIPNSVTNMQSTFSGCTKLTDLGDYVIPNSVTNMQSTFLRCTYLTVAPTIPNSVTNIYQIFYECTNLVSANVPESITAIPERAFYKCSSLKSIGPVGSGANVEIANTVTSIGREAFSGCTSLTDVNIPESVTKFEMQVFTYCSNLETISLPSNLTYMGGNCLGQGTNLSAINYNNTMSNWNSIYKQYDNWNSSRGEITVTCTDGTVIVPAYGS